MMMTRFGDATTLVAPARHRWSPPFWRENSDLIIALLSRQIAFVVSMVTDRNLAKCLSRELLRYRYRLSALSICALRVPSSNAITIKINIY